MREKRQLPLLLPALTRDSNQYSRKVADAMSKRQVVVVIGLLVVAVAAVLLVAKPWRTRLPIGQGQVVRIGAILPLSGDAASYGRSAREGIALAIDQINRAGGVRGRRLEVIYEDDRGQATSGVAAASKLCSVDRVPVIIGAIPSSVTLAIAPVCERSRVILMSPTSSAPKISEAGDYIFRAAASDETEGTTIAKYAVDHGLGRAAVLYINNDYGAGLKDVFVREVKRLGGEVVAVEAFAETATDFRSQLAKIAEKKPSAIYLVGQTEAGRALRQASDMGINARFLSSVLFEDPKVIAVAGAAAEGVVYSSRWYAPERRDKVVSEFAGAYRAKCQREPDVFAAYSYDATEIVARAMASGGLTPDEIKAALYATKGYQGVTGVITFDRNGDVQQPATLKTVKEGKFVFLDSGRE